MIITALSIIFFVTTFAALGRLVYSFYAEIEVSLNIFRLFAVAGVAFFSIQIINEWGLYGALAVLITASSSFYLMSEKAH